MAFNVLPISRRGNFLNDDFFKGFQQDYESAMQSVMSKAGAGRSTLADHFARSQDLGGSDDSKKASISETQDSYVIVLDMSDYINGSMAVKTRGYFVVVEASYKEKSFNRQFPMPKNTNFDAVTTAMSDEGILTVTAPRMGRQIQLQVSSDGHSAEPTVKLDAGEAISAEDKGQSSMTEAFKNLSIARKGKFFQDAYFENIFKDFDAAIEGKVSNQQQEKSVSNNTNIQQGILSEQEKFQIPQFARLNSYTNLRKWVPANETQAVTLTRDAKGYKIVMDVKNWETSLKASEGVLIVTGSRGALSFKRDFDLPGLKDPSQIVASASEDGVLTITVNIS